MANEDYLQQPKPTQAAQNTINSFANAQPSQQQLNYAQSMMQQANNNDKPITGSGMGQTAGTPNTNGAAVTGTANSYYQNLLNSPAYQNAIAQAQAQGYAVNNAASLIGQGTTNTATGSAGGTSAAGGTTGSAALDPAIAAYLAQIYGSGGQTPTMGQAQVDPNVKAQLEGIYGSNLQSALAALQQEYAGTDAAYALQMEEAARQHQADLNRTAVESQKAAQAWNETQNAYGLSSGTMGQAALARQNQLASDTAALRAANQQAQNRLALQRATAAAKYESAVRQAIADNDYQRAQALYNAAKDAEKWEQQLYLNQLSQQQQQEQARQNAYYNALMQQQSFQNQQARDEQNFQNQLAYAQYQYNLEHGLTTLNQMQQLGITAPASMTVGGTANEGIIKPTRPENYGQMVEQAVAAQAAPAGTGTYATAPAAAAPAAAAPAYDYAAYLAAVQAAQSAYTPNYAPGTTTVGVRPNLDVLK